MPQGDRGQPGSPMGLRHVRGHVCQALSRCRGAERGPPIDSPPGSSKSQALGGMGRTGP